MPGKLSDKQRRFCEEYLVDHNATQAAIRAGYSQKTARIQASKLLTKANIQDYLQSKVKVLMNSLEITQERILQEYARIAFFDPRRLRGTDGRAFELHQLDDDTAAAIAGVEEFAEFDEDGQQTGITKKIKIASKISALDALARIEGMFKDNLDINLPVTVVKTYYGKKKT